jgi:hypothetical protein
MHTSQNGADDRPVPIPLGWVTLLIAVHTALNLGCVESQSEPEGILGGVGVGKNVPTPTTTSV